MEQLKDWWQEASLQHQAGNLTAAEPIYKRILEQAPNHAETLNRLGKLNLELGNLDSAIRFLQKAVAVSPEHAPSHGCLGVALLQQNQIVKAIEAFRESLKLQPTQPAAADLLFYLGNAMRNQDLLEEAADAYRKALELEPEFAEACHNLADIYRLQGNSKEALQWFTRTTKIQPQFFQAYHNQGGILKILCRIEEAVVCFRRATELQPRFVESQRSLAVCLALLDRRPEAQEAFERALQLQPDSAGIHLDFGAFLYGQLKYDEALHHFERAVELEPDIPRAWKKLGNSLFENDRFEEARECFFRLASLQPHNPLWTFHAQTLCPTIYSNREQIAHYREGLTLHLQTLRKTNPKLTPDLLFETEVRPCFDLQFHGMDDRPIKEAFGTFFDQFFAKEKPTLGLGTPRIGFVLTYDQESLFYRHCAGLFDRFTPGAFVPIILCTPAAKPQLQRRIHNAEVDYLVLPQKIQEIAEAIRSAKLEVLYYYAIGTTVLSYFLPFHRLAPIQCNTWGIQVTSGIPAMDCYISSKLVEPEDAANHYSEELVLLDTLPAYPRRLPRPSRLQGRSNLGLPEDRHLYVCAQQLGKFHPDFDEFLAEVLRADPLGTVVITRGNRPELIEKLKARFQARIPDVCERFLFISNKRGDDYSSLLLQADVLLDPIHFGGVNTSYDAFSLGKPVVTLPSAFHRGRYTLGCYRMMGISDCIADSREEYVRLALRIATDPDYRNSLEKKISEASEVLFENLNVPLELERVLLEIVEKARQRG